MTVSEFVALDTDVIPYRRRFRYIAGSVTASILLQQIMYWAEKKNGVFWKFMRPAARNVMYKRGQSWTEELGFSYKEFLGALKKLESKKLVSHETNAQGLTFFDLNFRLLNSILAELYKSFAPVAKSPSKWDNYNLDDQTNLSNPQTTEIFLNRQTTKGVLAGDKRGPSR